MSICKNISALNVPDTVTLIAVSKQQPDDRVQGALNAGHRVFGENRIQEAQTRWTHRRESYPELKLHLIGPLQSNKASEAVALFDVIHTLDRPKLVDALVKECVAQSRHPEIFIQANTGEEPQKSGVLPQDLGALYSYAIDKGLNVTGLMCIPPVDEPAALHFALLKKLAARYDLPSLSMGMSGDYEKALALGATHIRLGTAIFGTRP